MVPGYHKSTGVKGNVTIGGRFMMCKSEICDVVTNGRIWQAPRPAAAAVVARSRVAQLEAACKITYNPFKPTTTCS